MIKLLPSLVIRVGDPPMSVEMLSTKCIYSHTKIRLPNRKYGSC